MKKILGFLKLMILMLIVIAMMIVFSDIFRVRKDELPNDTTNKVEGFYALEENSLDILFLGTSHTYYGFNPAVIYKETGLNSYVFAGECQPIEVTYHYLVEALKTQSPRMVVLDVFALLPSADVCQTEGIFKKNIEDLRFSTNKMEALSLLGKDQFLENLLDISMYKERWNELTEVDFRFPFESHFNENFGYTEGYPVNEPIYVREMFTTDEMIRPDREEMTYLFKIFDLIKENELDLLIVKTPYYETLEEYKVTNYIFKQAQDAGFDTLNFNQYYDELDFVFDRDGDIWHCNVRGAWKISHLLSDYLFEHMDISIQESIYDKQYQNLYVKTIQNLLWTQSDAQLYLEYLSQMDVALFVNYQGKPECSLNENQWKLLNQLNIRHFNPLVNYNAVIYQDKVLFEVNSNQEYTEGIMIEDEWVSISSYDSFVTYSLSDEQIEFNHYGLNLLIYDMKTKTLIDKISLDTIWGFQILR